MNTVTVGMDSGNAETLTIGRVLVLMAMLEAEGVPKTAEVVIETSKEVKEPGAARLVYRYALCATARWQSPPPPYIPDAAFRTPFGS